MTKRRIRSKKKILRAIRRGVAKTAFEMTAAPEGRKPAEEEKIHEKAIKILANAGGV